MSTATRTRNINIREIPSMLGLEEATPKRFTLWQRCAGNYAEARPGSGAVRDDPDVHEALTRWVGRSGMLGPTARRPARAATNRQIGLTGKPDAFIDAGSRYADGDGIAIVCPIENWEWRKPGLWRDDDGAPVASPGASAVAHALLTLYERAQWCIVIPVTGWRRRAIRAPIVVRRSVEMSDKLRADISDFRASIDAGEAPAPDARGNIACLATLAEHSAAKAQGRPVELNGAAAEKVETAVNDARAAEAALREHSAAAADLRENHANAMQKLRAALGDVHSADTGRIQLTMLVDQPEPSLEEEPRLSVEVVAGGQYERLHFRRAGARAASG